MLNDIEDMGKKTKNGLGGFQGSKVNSVLCNIYGAIFGRSLVVMICLIGWEFTQIKIS